jgi:hypothetical protein
LESWIPDEATRRRALSAVAFAIEIADQERDDAWYVRETPNGLRLMTGRLRACEITPSSARIAVIGPIPEEVRATLGAEIDDDSAFRAIPGGLVLTFPIERLGEQLDQLKHALSGFIELAMARVRQPPGLEDHVPEAVEYIADIVGRELPQPEPTADPSDAEPGELGDEAEVTAREPRIRGRAQIFERGERTIASLMDEIERKLIALPDLQRPFVWEDTKVRDLLDSLFLGFPVGTLVLWLTANEREARALGASDPILGATTLIIDGQQRLTSLYAVTRGQEVLSKDGKRRKITIAFRPRDGRFDVADAAIRSDPEYLPNVTVLWGRSPAPAAQIRRGLLNGLRDKGRAVDESYEDAVERNLEIARSIENYRFPTIDIREFANDENAEQDMSDIFVRINNQGKKLGQADFVLTLLSVFLPELRDRIEERARDMSQKGLILIDAQQLLRAACGVAFDRARMSAVYRLLRGVDPKTGDTNLDARRKRLDRLDEAARACLDPTPWRDYLLRVKHAGFVSQTLIASKSAIVNGYAFYIRGRRIEVPRKKLDELIARWIFGSLLTARYSVSSDTVFEQDLARLAASDGEGFLRALDDALNQTVTGDYWTRSLVAALTTQSTRAPGILAFRAAQVVLGTRALFSDQSLRDLLAPPTGGGRAAGEAHHLFPVAWLEEHGIPDRRRHNQVANLADVGWYDNSIIGAQNPARYVPRLRDQLDLDDEKWGRMCAEHALPLGWESMEYDVFLSERRHRMADIIRVAFRTLGAEADAPPLTPPWFLPGAQEVWSRIAEAERALRSVVRDVYVAKFGDAAANNIEAALSEPERDILARALRARPPGADPLTVIDYLYLSQLLPLLFKGGVWDEARRHLDAADGTKQRLQIALNQIAPVRNEIAHVREVEHDRLLRASVACSDILKMVQGP